MANFDKDRGDFNENDCEDNNKSDRDKAQEYADNLGHIKSPDEFIQKEITQLRLKSIVPLQQISHLHDWLEEKRKSRQSYRIFGETRTGMTIACEAYKLRHKPKQEIGKPPKIETE